MQTIDRDVEGERLRHVRALIEELLREADICGQVILGGRAGRFENFTHLGTSWCKARIERHGALDLIGVRSKAVDYVSQPPGTQQQHLAWTASTISGFAEIGAQVALSWVEAAKYVDAYTGAEHSPMDRDDPRDDPRDSGVRKFFGGFPPPEQQR